ncbi:MAG: hypothetical protein KC643_25290, partial [Nitrospira sp.]|nr:hypothetical protein [Nitrospira sp.]
MVAPLYTKGFPQCFLGIVIPHPPFPPTLLVPFLLLWAIIGGTTFFWTTQAQAIPAFARKYQVTCT